MKLLLIVANFLPEIGSAAHIYHDLGLDLVKRGHEVHVITSYPMEFYLNEKNSFISSPFCHCHDESQGPKLPSNDDMNDSTFT